MGLDRLGVLTVGTLAPKEGMHTLSSTPCLPFPAGLGSHRSSSAPQGHNIRAYPHASLGQQGTHSLGGCKPYKWPSGSRW